MITDGSMVEKASCEVSYGFVTFMAKKELGWFIYQIDWRNKSSAVFSSFAPTKAPRDLLAFVQECTGNRVQTVNYGHGYHGLYLDIMDN